jgi:23S rRNA (guanosine2251-2'-O)-methyltransferase
MRKLTHSEISARRVPAKDVETAERIPVVVMIDNVRSIYNVGSIFRSSDGAMIEKLILAGYSPHPPRKEIDKTALGSTTSVPWEHTKQPADILAKLKNEGFKICCLELTDKSIPYYSVKKADFPICLVVGNEIAGISKEIIELSDLALEIPMYGIKQSLNVAVAYGIAVFELAKIWRDAD